MRGQKVPALACQGAESLQCGRRGAAACTTWGMGMSAGMARGLGRCAAACMSSWAKADDNPDTS